MPTIKIPLVNLKREYSVLKKDIALQIKECLQTQHWILGDKVVDFENAVAKYIMSRYAISVASGTDALLLALRALAIKTRSNEYFEKKDEIITTPFTFIASAEAIVRAGATPVFVDIDPCTFTLSPAAIKKAITKNTIGILPVHLFGLSCDMDAIMDIARSRKLFVVEDVAQAFGATYKKKKAGSIGDAGAFSFFPSKNLSGYGDAGLVTTNDTTLTQLIKELRNHGQARVYDADHIGYNSRLDALQAGILSVKLKHIDAFNQARCEGARFYDEQLQGNRRVLPPCVPLQYGHVYNLYTIRVPENRDQLHKHLLSCGIDARVYYPLLLSSMKAYKHFPATSIPCARKAVTEVLSIPLNPFLTSKELCVTIRTLNAF